MMCPTVLHGGLCHSTSTPHQSGNNMKEKKEEMNSTVERRDNVYILYRNAVLVARLRA